MRPDTETKVHDVAIIGAGPSGLAVAARLREQTPSALYTDAEHHRYHWLRRHSHKTSILNHKTHSLHIPPANSTSMNNEISIIAFDATGDRWMARWHDRFQALQISHLRSPMFFHVDPGDRDSLLALAYEEDRVEELREIRNVVGKEISKHKKKDRARRRPCGCGGADNRGLIDERDRKDYYNPSARLFEDHCDRVVERYGLDDVVVQAKVEDVSYGYVDGILETSKVFTVRTSKGISYARTVVVAVGDTGPNISHEICKMPPPTPTPISIPDSSGRVCPCFCHSSALQPNFIPPHIKSKIDQGRETNIMVVGGGLTSAQVTDLAVRAGFSKVFHVMRGGLKVKPFDVDLGWVGKWKNVSKAEFWGSDDFQERIEMIARARNSGSVTPPYAKLLQHHVSTGRVVLATNTTICSTSYSSSPSPSPSSQTMTVTTTPPIPSLPPLDYIIFCTGSKSNIAELPFLRNLARQQGLAGLRRPGLPILTEELMVQGFQQGGEGEKEEEGVPLFVAGRLAALQLGPGAGNLEGAREGAERICWGVGEVLERVKDKGREREMGRGVGEWDWIGREGYNRYALFGGMEGVGEVEVC